MSASASLARLNEALRAEAALVAGVATLDLRNGVARLDPPELEHVGLPDGSRQVWVRDPKAPHGRRPATEAERAYGKLPELKAPEVRRLNRIDQRAALA